MSDLDKTLVCRMRISTQDSCLKNCKLTRLKNRTAAEYNCLAIDKFSNFLNQGGLDLKIPLSAFYSAPKEVIDEFVSRNPNNVTLLKFFFMIGDVKKCAERANHISETILSDLLLDTLNNYCNLENLNPLTLERKDYESFFNKRNHQFWKYIPPQKITRIIEDFKNKPLGDQFISLYDTIIDLNLFTSSHISESIENPEMNLELYVSMINDLNSLSKSIPHFYYSLIDQSLDYLIFQDINLNEVTHLEKIEKLNLILDNITQNYNPKEFQNQLYILYNLKNEINSYHKDLISGQKFLSILRNGDVKQFDDILKFFIGTDTDYFIQLIKNNRTDELFIEFFIYYCWLFRYEKCIHTLLNHEKFPNELLIRIIYYNYGKWIQNDNEAEDYFNSFTVFLTSFKSRQLLMETDIIKFDLNFSLCLFSNLDLENLDIYFSKNQSVEGTIDFFCDLFLNLGESKMEKFLIRNPFLFNYFIVFMSAYTHKESVKKFLVMYENQIKLIDSIFLLTEKIKKELDPDKEIFNLVSGKNENRINSILSLIHDSQNIDLVIKIFDLQNIFVDSNEKEIILQTLKDPFLKSTILKKFISNQTTVKDEPKNSDLLNNIMNNESNTVEFF
jgi:hypothetical protein